MAEFPVLPFYTDAYLADTTHLSTLEHGAYSLMLWRAWRTPGCCLPNDPEFLRRITKTTARQWERIWPTISEFWEERNGNLYQGRLTDEHDAVRRKSNRQSAKAKARWLKNNNSADAVASPGQCQSDASLNPSPSPSLNQEKKERSASADSKKEISDSFSRWWEVVTNKKGRAAALKAYGKVIAGGKRTESELIADWRAYDLYCRETDTYMCNPATWLNGERWADDLTIRRKATEFERLEAWANGDERDDHGPCEIDGDYVEVPEPGLGGDGRSLSPSLAEPVGSGREGSGNGVGQRVGQGEPAQAGGYPGNREVVQADIQRLAQVAAKRAKPPGYHGEDS